MFKRYLLIIIVVLIIMLGSFYYYFFLKPFSQSEKQEKEAVLVIDFGERKRAFTGEIIEGMTFLDALFASSKAGNFSFDFDKYVLKRVEQVEESEKKWNAYSNKEKVEDYLDNILIEPGDKLELKLE